MELQLTTDLAVYKQPIVFNFEQLKEELNQSLERYRGLVVTEDAIKDAKTDRARLNKLKAALDDKRKEVKAECLRPYNAFADQISEITKMIDGPIGEIDKQVKAFDEAKKQEKLDEITAFYNENVGMCADYVSFTQIFNPRWLNATYAMGDIHNEIMAHFLRIEDDLKVIRDQKSDFEAEMLEEYTHQQSINKALAKKMALEERRAKIEAEKQRLHDSNPLEKPNAAPPRQQPTRFTAPDAVPMGAAPPATEPAKVYTLDFRVHATAQQLSALKVFFKDNNISYGRVPQEDMA